MPMRAKIKRVIATKSNDMLIRVGSDPNNTSIIHEIGSNTPLKIQAKPLERERFVDDIRVLLHKKKPQS
jgi:hypothetical protein